MSKLIASLITFFTTSTYTPRGRRYHEASHTIMGLDRGHIPLEVVADESEGFVKFDTSEISDEDGLWIGLAGTVGSEQFCDEYGTGSESDDDLAGPYWKRLLASGNSRMMADRIHGQVWLRAFELSEEIHTLAAELESRPRMTQDQLRQVFQKHACLRKYVRLFPKPITSHRGGASMRGSIQQLAPMASVLVERVRTANMSADKRAKVLQALENVPENHFSVKLRR